MSGVLTWARCPAAVSMSQRVHAMACCKISVQEDHRARPLLVRGSLIQGRAIPVHGQ